MTADVFASAAQAFTRLVQSLPAAAWDGPGLGEWDMRALIGHTSRSFVTVSTYLRTPATDEDVSSAVEYYVKIRDYMSSSGAAAIMERGRQAGRDLGDDPVAAIEQLSARTLADVADAGDPLITVIGGLGIRLSAYLQTRIFELTVHSLDIAAAAGVTADLPSEALEAAAVLATRISVALGEGDTVLRALTGRTPLPQPFSVT
ncbi:mycothiol maleylpyruvate isomerase [Mycobacterium sp. 852013-50091_SCH5140682]|uniref:maleylpyruvate isomerase N-terminal domain-containing protein n=1 Tax=Mycobacterium sp. 852013-50091_SCH5140682 TaxID=1834109 RepID=UPI0007EA3CE6|nr:maleylpyruvate isomerase N-terminal domain-containing protein [Mycobacterium sp. 852013-50091_SCH5140682]OBC06757.1 mycothiol maleylpyruvate isomerase [Mycobacterium sp. 852013-50091_SCH5140682]